MLRHRLAMAAAILVPLLALLWLDAGARDEHHLHLGARRFTRRLFTESGWSLVSMLER